MVAWRFAASARRQGYLDLWLIKTRPMIDPVPKECQTPQFYPASMLTTSLLEKASFKSQINILQDFHSNQSLKSNLYPLFWPDQES